MLGYKAISRVIVSGRTQFQHQTARTVNSRRSMTVITLKTFSQMVGGFEAQGFGKQTKIQGKRIRGLRVAFDSAVRLHKCLIEGGLNLREKLRVTTCVIRSSDRGRHL